MIWPFTRKRRPPAPGPAPRDLVPGGFHDTHAHVLPGIDDGAVDAAESHAMLDGLAELGYVRVAATSHFNHSLFEGVDRETTGRLVGELARARPGGPRLVAGGEIWFDERALDPGRLAKLPGYGGHPIHLVEFGTQPGAPPEGLEELVFRLQVRDTTIVIAHAERYPDVQRNPLRLEPLRRAGALVQVNLMSLVGRYGQRVMTAAWEILEGGYADVVGSDLHRAVDLPSLGRGLEELARWDAGELERLAAVNPAALLDGEPEEVRGRD